MSKLKDRFGEEWYHMLSEFLEGPSMNQIGMFLNKAHRALDVYPPMEDTFKAFRLTPFTKVKVVILGMDPYHTPKMATGLAFSSGDPFTVPPSLRNIFKEIEADIYDGMKLDQNPDLTRWAKQGVLLLNTALSVEKGKAGSHTKLWKKFTEHVISTLSEHNSGIIYMLWGNHAKSFIPLIDRENNYILTAVHPSPLSASRGWYGSKHFSKANQVLSEMNKVDESITPIEW